MSDNNNHIKTYTAEDIRNYWSGKMSPREMHALEKASLDDPFLADALEGYSSVNSQTAANDIEWLRKNLNASEKDEKKAVPLFKQSWMRVAAALIIIGGLGTLSYFVFSPEKNREVAQTKTVANKEQATELKKDTVVVSAKDSSTNYFNRQAEQKTTDVNVNRQQAVIAKINTEKLRAIPAPAFQFKTQSITSADEPSLPPTVSDSAKLAELFSDNDDLKKEKSSPVANMLRGKVSGVNVEKEPLTATAQNFSTLNNNISGRITNSKNEPVAGAVVKANNLNNVTVSDKNGFFSLPASEATKSDSVSINSIGYVSANVALNANTQNNIKLEESTSALNDVVVVGYGSKKKSARARAAAVSPVDTLQPAPEDGWEDYYNYVQRNTETFPDIDGEIVVRFDIDKKGKPNNIVVEKSLTDAADKEAIRIIKEGPGWKANSKKKKVRLTIKF
ncbi:energy transducer TonB [Pinibacter aurantiacus]|uniref:Carboxypeptidase-like regulatory domain-containing protein n=1 Tax=Pinibacter aurantiacus TaxID=2851599 RepID=A0A9E2S8Q8_9BACT|nr:energy transducer TonB [Pinibacter aurantiacus]MBV4356983.1 carboxypeptidase-like regulatory domain-containing protein [Pinibacter aurantiacus]